MRFSIRIPRGCFFIVKFHISAYVRGIGIYHNTSELGALGEELGCRYLKDKGYRILARNYCNTYGRRIGEIDIVAEQGNELVFVEVKSRLKKDEDDILPEAGITREKLRKMNRIAQCYLKESHRESSHYRFDALSIFYDASSKKASIRHLEYIFF